MVRARTKDAITPRARAAAPLTRNVSASWADLVFTVDSRIPTQTFAHRLPPGVEDGTAHVRGTAQVPVVDPRVDLPVEGHDGLLDLLPDETGAGMRVARARRVDDDDVVGLGLGADALGEGRHQGRRRASSHRLGDIGHGGDRHGDAPRLDDRLLVGQCGRLVGDQRGGDDHHDDDDAEDGDEDAPGERLPQPHTTPDRRRDGVVPVLLARISMAERNAQNHRHRG